MRFPVLNKWTVFALRVLSLLITSVSLPNHKHISAKYVKPISNVYPRSSAFYRNDSGMCSPAYVTGLSSRRQQKTAAAAVGSQASDVAHSYFCFAQAIVRAQFVKVDFPLCIFAVRHDLCSPTHVLGEDCVNVAHGGGHPCRKQQHKGGGNATRAFLRRRVRAICVERRVVCCR